MKRLFPLAALMLGACAVPNAQPVASTGADRAPPLVTRAPLPPCCSSPTRWPEVSPEGQPAPRSPPARHAQSNSPQAAAPTELSIAKGNRAFAVSLYRKLATKPGNVSISPISVAGAFGPAAVGARGETRAEIGKVLHFPADDEVLDSSLGSILRSLESGGEGPQVSIANALWLGNRVKIEPSFVERTKRSYDAEVDTVDFNNSSAAAARINAWVGRETNSRIPELFKPDAFDSDTALVITNAVYFLGKWSQQFEARRTRPRPFYLADGTTRQVSMMSDEDMVVRLAGPEPGAASAGVKNGVQLLELPYKGDRLSMVIILPHARDGLAPLEAQLSAAKLDQWLRQLDSSQPSDNITDELPKLEIESSYSLVEPLKALGVKVAFDSRRADFTGISHERGEMLFIDAVEHKTFISIDEKGTEAAAATGIEVSMERGGPVFRADHPFLFLIRDRTTGAILFLGRVVEP